MIANLAGPDIIIVIVILGVVLFGGKAIPSIARNLGSAKSEFEKGLKESKNKAEAETEPKSEQ